MLHSLVLLDFIIFVSTLFVGVVVAKESDPVLGRQQNFLDLHLLEGERLHLSCVYAGSALITNHHDR